MRVTVPILAPVTYSVPLSTWESNVFRFLCRVAADPVQLSSKPIELRVAGGWVRDKLLSRPTGDIDIAVRHVSGIQFAERVHQFAQTAAAFRASRPSSTNEYIPDTSSIALIAPNPAMSRHLETAAVRLDGHDLDFVQLRTENYAQGANHRVPVAVAAGTPEEDARRRDFTVNALFYNLHTKSVEDFTGMGLEDLDRGILRTPLASTTTLLEDPLRSLRALRFACKLKFQLHHELQQAMAMEELHDSLMRKVSRERVGIEIMQIVQSDDVEFGLQMIDKYDLVDAVFLETFRDSSLSTSSSSRYCEGLTRVNQLLKMWETQKYEVSESDRISFESYGRTLLILSALPWDTNRLITMISKALRREKKLVQDGRRILLYSTKLEEKVKVWLESRKIRDTHIEREAWVQIAEIVHLAGEHLWISVILCAALRMNYADLLPELVSSGIGKRICKETPVVNGLTLQEELGLKTGPEVGQALKELVKLQLLNHRRPLNITDNESVSGEQINSKNYIKLLKEKGFLVGKVA